MMEPTRVISSESALERAFAPRPRPVAPKPKYQPNLTPLIDVLFMLLLFFLLGTRFRQMEGDIPGSLPRLETGAAVATAAGPIEKPIILTLRPGGAANDTATYEISGQKIALASATELHDKLVSLRAYLGSDVPIIIKPDAGVRWQFVVEAYNQAVREKFTRVGFARADG